MNRSDREAWQSARTLADLGELTAQWIEGTIGEQPGYCGPTDIETPEMARVLTALNRAGYMTTQSQAGVTGPGYDGAGWEQRAAVEGFASPIAAYLLMDAAEKAGLWFTGHDPRKLPRWRIRTGGAVVITTRAGEPYTQFGVQFSRRFLRGTYAGVCDPLAVAAVCSAWQVTVIDPEWGRPGLLWRTLRNAITGKESPSGQA
jgi:hypothetical protein